MKLLLTHWLPFILYATLIFYVSSQRLPELPILFQINYIDLVAHFFAYALFAYLAYRALSRTPNKVLQKHLLFATLIISILYGFSDEWHQSYVPGRLMSVSDFLFDAFGAIVMVLLLRMKPRIHAKK